MKVFRELNETLLEDACKLGLIHSIRMGFSFFTGEKVEETFRRTEVFEMTLSHMKELSDNE